MGVVSPVSLNVSLYVATQTCTGLKAVVYMLYAYAIPTYPLPFGANERIQVQGIPYHFYGKAAGSGRSEDGSISECSALWEPGHR